MKTIRFDPAFSGEAFLGASPDYPEAVAVIYGMPMD